MERVGVAIAIIVAGEQILICRRGQAVHLGGFWEFPGGKIEADESPADAVLREVREELGVDAKIIEPLEPIDHDYPQLRVRLHPFWCVLIAGEPAALAADSLRWTDAASLAQEQFPKANAELIQRIIARFAAR